jgi:1,6-anhydro-N-acetylmuramate kinase
MLDVRLLDRLHALQHRRRWLIGLRLSAGCRRLRAALVGVEGRGLAAKAEVFAHVQAQPARHVRRAYAQLHRTGRSARGCPALFAAQLAECQAALLGELAAHVAPVWDRVLAVAVDDPGLWSSAAGLRGWQGLCDAARLAELSGQNVIDGFAARDLAQEGRGRPLTPIPDWMLLRDLQKHRLLVEWGRAVCCTYLPASRDTSGAGQVLAVRVIRRVDLAGSCDGTEGLVVAERVRQQIPPGLRIDQLLWASRGADSLACRQLAERLGATPLAFEQLSLPRQALRPAAVALLGMLHLDQAPANLPAITGARTSRVLGRLTGGSLPAWHRLVVELSTARPSVMPLRSAV